MRILLLLTVVGLSQLLWGCMGADTSDPRRGGLFGYSPKNYEARLESRRQDLSYLEEANARQEERSMELERTKSAKQAKVAAQRKKVARLNSEIDGLSGKINRAKKNPNADQSRVQELSRRRQHLESQAHDLSGSEAEKEAKVRELRRQLRDLEAEADALSRM